MGMTTAVDSHVREYASLKTHLMMYVYSQYPGTPRNITLKQMISSELETSLSQSSLNQCRQAIKSDLLISEPALCSIRRELYSGEIIHGTLFSFVGRVCI